MQWNIGGARIRTPEADPTALDSYSIESLEYLAKIALEHEPDIITLQETHEGPDGHNQAQALAEVLGLGFWENDTHDESHIEKGQMFGQGIISRFPITDHSFKRLPNPNLSLVTSDGDELHSHNYGITSVNIAAPGGKIRIQTFHLPALHFFEVTPDMQAGRDVLDVVTSSIEDPTFPTLLPGDYNLDVKNVLDLLPGLKQKGFNEAHTPIGTTPKGKRLDHMLHYGLQDIAIKVIDSALTDHYPLLADFDLAGS